MWIRRRRRASSVVSCSSQALDLRGEDPLQLTALALQSHRPRPRARNPLRPCSRTPSPPRPAKLERAATGGNPDQPRRAGWSCRHRRSRCAAIRGACGGIMSREAARNRSRRRARSHRNRCIASPLSSPGGAFRTGPVQKAALYRPVHAYPNRPAPRGDLAPVFEEILGQQRDHLVPHDLVHIRSGVAAGEIGMTDLVVTVIEILDPFIDDRQKDRQIDARASRTPPSEHSDRA